MKAPVSFTVLLLMHTKLEHLYHSVLCSCACLLVDSNAGRSRDEQAERMPNFDPRRRLSGAASKVCN